ncbi:ABC transporter ATP-binding protein [Polynucleobacter sp. JS-Safj-400b-B2]|uniref:ABC transporter ATP-binding protein n=1 Tax=Polynucleobacter sp. JS-Safj-400b-B2 TaxID=2576921 RepID=UPI001C0D2EB4|nr:ABC transporter ATP-binding protein [Polynucleobacter sp. JS-Safj-400b-B2]MBU3625049.1 ABC transporter ATP-binding protein [Polynucleobacter sp. JS-Safj-400b-B2]
MSAIIVSDLSKAYKQYSSKWARFAEWVVPFFGDRHKLKWVLKDISFSVKPGEALGIIGINGAGKSTLLKMITGTVKPTTGEVIINGKVAALLELGMGFHPDFTGRQNAYMAGQLMGISTEELSSLMPSVESFAEIGDYFDRPVRVYSSGMQVRLAFAVATAIRPDVLIIDEALSVGDAYFQHKSFERIREFQRLGTTLLIVSHDKAAIQSICSRAILLGDGKVLMEGEPEGVMDYYNAMLSGHQDAQKILQGSSIDGRLKIKSGSGEIQFESISLQNLDGQDIEVIGVGQTVILRIVFRTFVDIPQLTVGYSIKDRLGLILYGTNTHHLGFPLENLKAQQEVAVEFKFVANMGVGTFSIACSLHTGDTHLSKNFAWQDLALVFTAINIDKPFFLGSSWLPPQVVKK